MELNRLFDVITKYHIRYGYTYAFWEKENSETHNRLIRSWFPKGTKKIIPKVDPSIENWIKNYPKNYRFTSIPENFFLKTNLKFS